MKRVSKEVNRANKARAQVKAAAKEAGKGMTSSSKAKGSTQRKTTPKRAGDITGKRTYRYGNQTKRQGNASPDSDVNKKLRADATKRRLKRNTSAARTAVKKAAAETAAKSTARRATAKTIAKRVPAVGLAMTAIDLADKYGGKGAPAQGRRVRKNGVSTRKK